MPKLQHDPMQTLSNSANPNGVGSADLLGQSVSMKVTSDCAMLINRNHPIIANAIARRRKQVVSRSERKNYPLVSALKNLILCVSRPP
jgi:hypothetical protein